MEHYINEKWDELFILYLKNSSIPYFKNKFLVITKDQYHVLEIPI